MTGRDLPPRSDQPFPASGKGFLFPPVVWTVYFFLIYSVQGAWCASPLRSTEFIGANALNLVLALITIAALAAIAIAGGWAYRDWRRIERRSSERDEAAGQGMFLAYGALLNAALFLVATFWIGASILMMEPCGGRLVKSAGADAASLPSARHTPRAAL